MKQFIKPMILLVLIMLIFGGFLSQNLKLKYENKQLKQELNISKEKIETQNELYDLRNVLDILTYSILTHLSDGDTNYLKDKITENIIISKNKIISNNKTANTKYEFEMPKTQLILRQRAYMFGNDKKYFYSIYEILSNYNDKSILKTLNIYFKLDKGKWKMDYLCVDE